MEINWGWGGSIEEQLNDYGCKFDKNKVKRIESNITRLYGYP